MVQSIAAKDVTLRELKQNFGIQIVQDATFFPEWLDGLEALNKEEQHLLDRVKANFLELMDDPPMLENTVKMVVLAPLLDLAGFYHKPFILFQLFVIITFNIFDNFNIANNITPKTVS